MYGKVKREMPAVYIMPDKGIYGRRNRRISVMSGSAVGTFGIF